MKKKVMANKYFSGFGDISEKSDVIFERNQKT